ncbi:hypothetical protein ABH15_09800 [Methanoculleus taiwanensis]|uniref:DUF1894 domain-containing protein n=1 Tax=Methanoculleus taiwanensis TaxID=1550565 RepID=A0A498H1V5_9EURY|nr:DUF1894 domain-containing protein [Methanoculleus taiwanensis]RXE56377.1 hypothetical protein ABH15_09800 [Methanoculleus taiwanensis]
MPSRCINNLGGKVLLKDTTPDEVNRYVTKNSKEQYELYPEFVFRDIRILLKAPMLLGMQIRRQKILLPFTKLCPGYGTVLYEINATEDDFAYLRAHLKKPADER